MMPAATLTVRPARPTALTRLRPATRLAVLGLGLLTCLILPPALLAAWLILLMVVLVQSGLTTTDLVTTAKPWWPLAIIVVAIHAFTTTDAAPLGEPSLTGVAAGFFALMRVAATVLCLWIFLRSGDLTELAAGLSWWLRPLRSMIGDPVRIGVVLAVALGAAPRAVADARRIDGVVRLRRSVANTGDNVPRRSVRWSRRVLDWGRLVVPLVEGIFRRADGISLALAGRMPRPDLALAGPTGREWAVLSVWLLGGGLFWYFMP